MEPATTDQQAIYRKMLIPVTIMFLVGVAIGMGVLLGLPSAVEMNRGAIFHLILPAFVVSELGWLAYGYLGDPKRKFFLETSTNQFIFLALAYYSGGLESSFIWTLVLPVMFPTLMLEERAATINWSVSLLGLVALGLWGTPEGLSNGHLAILISQALFVSVVFGVYLYLADQLLRVKGEKEKALELAHENDVLLETLEDGIVAVDRAGVIVRWNTAAARLTGVPTEHALGKPVAEQLHATGVTLFGTDGLVEQSLVNQQKQSLDQIQLQAQDHRTHDVTLTVTPVTEAGSLGSLIVLRPIVHPWGTVIDQATRQPLPLVLVRVWNQDKTKILESRATDPQGRFGFVLTPGSYVVTATKAGYRFVPSDGTDGQPITITASSGIADVVILLEPVAEVRAINRSSIGNPTK